MIATGTCDAMVQDIMDSPSEDLFQKPMMDMEQGSSGAMDSDRKRKGTLLDTSGMESVDSDPDDDDDHMSRISCDDSRKFLRSNHSEIEKRRRDKMNSYIAELATMIPLCNAMNRKLDKLTVLRMAVQHLKTLRGAGNMKTEISRKPSFITDSELKHLILKAADGFLFVVSCDRGRILYVSESVQNVLRYTQSEYIGQSMFDFLHPKDISKVKEQLLSSVGAPREKLIDAKTMTPIKTELPQGHSTLCPGARRAFFCRMKMNSKVKTERDGDLYSCGRKKKPDRKTYSVIRCTGYLKSWPPAKLGIQQDEVESESETCNLCCLVAIGHSLPSYSMTCMDNTPNIEIRPTQFMSRYSPDGKFIYVDQSTTVILGYLPQELLGTSVYEYYHFKDIEPLSEMHKRTLLSTERITSPVYQFKAKDGTFLHLKTEAFSFKNPWTKEVDYIVANNTLVPVIEVTSTEHNDTKSGYATDSSAEWIQTNERIMLQVSSRKNINSQDSQGGTCPGAGKIGRQIAEEILEMQEDGNSLTVDSATRSPLSQGKMCNDDGSIAGSHSAMLNEQMHSDHPSTNHMPINGLANHSAGQEQTSGLLLTNLMEQDTLSDSSNTDANDEAAMAVIMSLLEADAGLGGPVDFSDLPWPL